MRVDFYNHHDQVPGSLLLPGLLFIRVLLILCFLPAVFLAGCSRSSNEAPIVPPVTYPLQREYIGYGVVNVPFTHLLSESGSKGVSIGYLRRGTVVRVLERKPVVNRGSAESWVLAEGNYQDGAAVSRGWLQETDLEIYQNESMAITASKAMSL